MKMWLYPNSYENEVVFSQLKPKCGLLLHFHSNSHWRQGGAAQGRAGFVWDNLQRKYKQRYKQGRVWKHSYPLPCEWREGVTHWKWLVFSPSALPALWSLVGPKMARRKAGKSHGPPCSDTLCQARGVTASGAIQTIPHEPCSCMGQAAEATSWSSSRIHIVASSWRHYSSLAVSRVTNWTGEFYLVANFLLFRFPGSSSIPDWRL